MRGPTSAPTSRNLRTWPTKRRRHWRQKASKPSPIAATSKARRSSHAKRPASRSRCQNLRHRMRSRKAASASRISATWLRSTFTFVLPVRSSPTTSRTRKMDWSWPLLDQRVPHLCAEGSVHEGTATPHHAVGARVRCRCRAGAPGQKSECDAYSPRDGRASVWHAEDVDGGDALSDEDAAQGGDRDGIARARLQPHARDEHPWYQTAPRGDPGVRSVYGCARRVTVQVAQRGPRVRSD